MNISAAKKIPSPTDLCVDSRAVENWPVEEVIQLWNQNGINKIINSSDMLHCRAHFVLFSYVGGDWGVTNFYDGLPVVKVGLSASVPVQHRTHVLCHEIGHALGLPHNSGQSCMNIELFLKTPSPQDLQEVAKFPWDSAKAARQAVPQ